MTAAGAGEGVPLWIDRFLSRDVCDRLLDELDVAFWKASTVVLRGPGGAMRTGYSGSRVSDTAHERWFSPALRRRLRGIERRLEPVIGSAAGRFEPWQATRYRRGQKFDYHYDAGYWTGDPCGRSRADDFDLPEHHARRRRHGQ